jgi:hypothetical protein
MILWQSRIIRRTERLIEFKHFHDLKENFSDHEEKHVYSH